MSSSIHFSDNELRCKCCGANNIKPELIEALEKLRSSYGKPMVVTSGYRCKKHNIDVGGHPKSAHCQGLAVDISMTNSFERYCFLWAVLSVKDFQGVGIDSQFIHLDLKERSGKVQIVFTY